MIDWWHTSACTACNQIVTHELNSNTGSPGTIAQIQQWYADCIKNHPDCALDGFSPASNNPAWTPTRLLNIGEADASPDCFLQLSNEVSPQPYITLSHCWGTPDGPRPPKLTTSNFDSMRACIRTEDLPRTFKNAIQVARSLGIRFLWIDSLCIIQDSMEDWRRESRLMNNVYRNSACNIMASAAVDCQGGLFFNRDPQRLGVFILENRQISNLSYESAVCFAQDYIDANSERGKDTPLHSRGWVCQERWLAPRQISFHSNQVFWECTKLKACEIFPSWEASGDHGGNLLTRRPTAAQAYTNPVSWHAEAANQSDSVNFSWRAIVGHYTTCTLTEEQDKLIAIQGLANVYKLCEDDDYLAGLWRKYLPSGLVWTTRNGIQANGEATYRPSTYRAPSWSWASVEGIIEIFPEARPRENRWVELCEVLQAKTTPLGEETTGQVSDGYIRLRGRLLDTEGMSFHTSPKGKVVQIARSRDSDPPKSWINCQIDDSAQWSPRNNALLPVLQYDHLSPQSCMLRGLILVPVEGRADTYERVGTWNDNATRGGVIDPFGWFKEAMRREEREITLI